MSITTSTGTTVSIQDEGRDRVVVLESPTAPPAMQRTVAGRLVIGGFQPAPFAPWAARPEVLRAIADLVEAELAATGTTA